jgi:glycosyltransferase involved in cell wall biosynthesis
MRICLFTPSFLPEIGGMEMVIDRLAREFESRGHTAVVLAQRSRHNHEIPQLPYEVIYYPRPRSAVWLLQNVKHILLREHEKHHFDVIHAHMAYPTGYIACALKKKMGVPVVITSHKGDIIPESRYRQRWIPCNRMRWAMMTADAVTGVSAELKKIIDEMTGGRARSCVIPNGVDMPPDRAGQMPQNCAGIAGRAFMLTLGRLHQYKGLDVLLDAVRRLREHGTEIPHLVIAGDGKEMENLQKQASQANLTDKVIFTGAVFGEQKHWLLKNCKFFLQPSRAEGMPLTVLEAMAYGKAVIGTRISGTIELISHNENGVLVEANDPISLAQAIADLCANKNINRMEAAAKSFASQMAWPLITDKYLALYCQSLQ